jgi:DNA-directed RNA polymerase specialized sigma24 family protein
MKYYLNPKWIYRFVRNKLADRVRVIKRNRKPEQPHFVLGVHKSIHTTGDNNG